MLQAATNSSAATAITLIATATNGLVTSAITNGLATIAYVNTATNGLVTAGITNGLATTNFVLSQGYATATVTNGLATIAYVNTATNGLVTVGITNGLATIGYDNFGTNFLGTNDLAQLNSASNVLAGKIISATNGLATTNYVASQGYAAVKTIWAGTSGGTAVLANKTVFWPPNNSSSTATLTDGAGTGTRVPVPETITLTNLYLIISAAPGGSHTNTFAIMTNGVASPLTVMIFNTGITATNNTTASVTIPAGTEIGVKITTQSGATTANWEWTFEGR